MLLIRSLFAFFFLTLRIEDYYNAILKGGKKASQKSQPITSKITKHAKFN